MRGAGVASALFTFWFSLLQLPITGAFFAISRRFNRDLTSSANTLKKGGRRASFLPSAPLVLGAVMMASEEIGQMYGGLVFLKTRQRESLVEFYKKTIGMRAWLEQPDITILAHGNLLLGFHQRSDEAPETTGMYTFVYPSKQQVDDRYERLKDIAGGPPRENKRYKIYQFFANDPEGRKLEFQAFLHPLTTVSSEVLKGT
jgi:hypothetical protein